MKFIYLILSIFFIVLFLIIYFQNIIYWTYTMMFFNSYKSATFVLLAIAVICFLAGAFTVLAVKSFLWSDNSDIDDWFDL